MPIPDNGRCGGACRGGWTVEEFLAGYDGADRRYELFDGHVLAMPRPARRMRIVTSVRSFALGSSRHAAFSAKPASCSPSVAKLGIRSI
jgi:hypothetical protein